MLAANSGYVTEEAWPLRYQPSFINGEWDQYLPASRTDFYVGLVYVGVKASVDPSLSALAHPASGAATASQREPASLTLPDSSQARSAPRPIPPYSPFFQVSAKSACGGGREFKLDLSELGTARFEAAFEDAVDVTKKLLASREKSSQLKRWRTTLEDTCGADFQYPTSPTFGNLKSAIRDAVMTGMLRGETWYREFCVKVRLFQQSLPTQITPSNNMREFHSKNCWH